MDTMYHNGKFMTLLEVIGELRAEIESIGRISEGRARQRDDVMVQNSNLLNTNKRLTAEVKQEKDHTKTVWREQQVQIKERDHRLAIAWEKNQRLRETLKGIKVLTDRVLRGDTEVLVSDIADFTEQALEGEGE